MKIYSERNLFSTIYWFFSNCLFFLLQYNFNVNLNKQVLPPRDQQVSLIAVRAANITSHIQPEEWDKGEDWSVCRQGRSENPPGAAWRQYQASRLLCFCACCIFSLRRWGVTLSQIWVGWALTTWWNTSVLQHLTGKVMADYELWAFIFVL